MFNNPNNRQGCNTLIRVFLNWCLNVKGMGFVGIERKNAEFKSDKLDLKSRQL